MSKSLLDDADQWHKRATATAAKAKITERQEDRERLLKVAKEYEDIARRAELNASLIGEVASA